MSTQLGLVVCLSSPPSVGLRTARRRQLPYRTTLEKGLANTSFLPYLVFAKIFQRCRWFILVNLTHFGPCVILNHFSMITQFYSFFDIFMIYARSTSYFLETNSSFVKHCPQRYYFKSSTVRTPYTGCFYHTQQCHRFNATEKWRNAGLFGLPRHSYVEATAWGKLVLACVQILFKIFGNIRLLARKNINSLIAPTY